MTSATLQFAAPMTHGTYNFRLYANNGSSVSVATTSVTVQAPPVLRPCGRLSAWKTSPTRRGSAASASRLSTPVLPPSARLRRPHHRLLRLHERPQRRLRRAIRRLRSRHAHRRADRQQRGPVGLRVPGSRARRAVDWSEGARRHRRGEHERCDRRASVRDREQDTVERSDRQHVARPSHLRAGRERPAGAGRSAGDGRWAHRRDIGRQPSARNQTTGQPGYAGITSPCNAPSAICVGAANTQNTVHARATTSWRRTAREGRPGTTATPSRT